ncbi:transporter, partial [Ceraceosorus guamensis]
LEPQEYKRLLRKIDLAIVPYVTLLYLLSFLDRVNIGQAATLGLRTDLGLVGNQYAVALTVFFVSYVAVELPSMIWFKKIGVRYCIPAIMVAWAIVMTLMGVVHNAAGLQAARFFLGLCEGPLFPLLNYMLSCWYTRKQQGTRVAIFFSGATLSGAFGGILAYGLSRIPMPAGPFQGENWRWIFIIEGILTLVCALPGYWLLVDFPAVEKRLLSPLESAQWNHVLAKSQGVTNAEVPFSWSQVKSGVAEWRTWVHAIMYLAIANPLYSLALFTPQIITGLGSFPRTSANLLSVPPYVVGYITTIAMAWFSDKFLVRSIPIIAGMLVTIVGYIILICDVSAGVKYFALHLTVAGVSPCIALAITWTGNTFGPAYKRATSMAIFFSFGNSAGLISSNVYPLAEAPRYFKGHGINLGFSVLAIACAVVLGLANMRENKQRDKISYANPDGSSADPLKANDEDEKARWGLTGMSREDIVLLGDKHP